jgi:hypothetical protein
MTWRAAYARSYRKEDDDMGCPGDTEMQDDAAGDDADDMDADDGRHEYTMLATSSIFHQ